MEKIMTRMDGGFPVELSESEIRSDLEAGTDDAADRIFHGSSADR